MKQFKDFEMTGPMDQLLAFIETVVKNLPSGWARDLDAEQRLRSMDGTDAGYAFARDKKDQAIIGLFLAKEPDRLWMPNIVPREIGELSIDQYNAALEEFADITRRHLGGFGEVKLHTTSDEAKISD